MKVCRGIHAEELVEQFHQAPHETGWRISDGRYLVHSTTLPAWNLIKKDGALLSPNELKKAGIQVDEIGLKPMLEPEDYSDYIMLDMPEGCGELVVNSRNLGRVCTDPDARYTPGARLYFDAKRMFDDGIATRDGMHPAKVRSRLPLKNYLLAAVTAAHVTDDMRWTPTLFTEKANEWFYSMYALPQSRKSVPISVLPPALPPRLCSRRGAAPGSRPRSGRSG